MKPSEVSVTHAAMLVNLYGAGPVLVSALKKYLLFNFVKVKNFPLQHSDLEKINPRNSHCLFRKADEY